MTRRNSFAALLVVMFLSSRAPGAPASEPAAAPAATRPASLLDLKIERLVVFKDGHGLVIKSGGATADGEGRAFITDIPDAAVLGRFWAMSEDDKILAMRAEWDEKKELRDRATACITMAELLRANVGKNVTLEMIDKLEKGAPVTRQCRIVELLDVPADAGSPTPARLSLASSRHPGVSAVFYSAMIQEGVASSGSFTPANLAGEGTLSRDLLPSGGEFVVVAENDARIILPVSHVQSIRGTDDIVTKTTRRQELFTRTKRLSFDFGKESAGKAVKVRLFYFTAGLRWIPTYRLSGELKDSADLALQGEIINEVADAEHAALDLVVGVPNFRFADTASPLTLEQALRAVSQSLFPGCNTLLNSQFSNSDKRARVEVRAPADAAPGVAPELAGASGEQDLFVYGVKDFSLNKGARATVPLWQQKADLRHVYTFDVNARRSRASGALLDDARGDSSDDAARAAAARIAPRGRSPNRIVMNQVWHQLELTNTGSVPWTTGAALMLRGTLPLGQDLLVYTPPGGKTLLPVTVAVDVRGSVEEREAERKAKAFHFDGDDYIEVRKKGTITVTSYRKEKSAMRITLSTGGKVTAASDGGTIDLNDFRSGDWEEGNFRVNNHSDVRWELNLDAGESKTLSYEVSFYTR